MALKPYREQPLSIRASATHFPSVSPTSNMAYTLTLKVLSCIAPEGEYFVVVAKNKVDKKERNESKTSTTKKGVNPSWTHVVEMYV